MGWIITKIEKPREKPEGFRTFTGPREEWEKAANRNLYLIEVFPEEEFAAKWRNLPLPDYSLSVIDGKAVNWARDPARQRRMIWHTQCLPFLKKAIKIFGTQPNEVEVSFREIADKMEVKFSYKRTYIGQKLGQLWKGGLIRRFIRSNSYKHSKWISTGGRNYGVHYILQQPPEKGESSDGLIRYPDPDRPGDAGDGRK